jgi:hypothetical protein
MTDWNGGPLNGSAVETREMIARSLADGIVTLPFPAGTEYQVPFGTTITYGGVIGTMVTAIATPEPGGIPLSPPDGAAGAGDRRRDRVARKRRNCCILR